MVVLPEVDSGIPVEVFIGTVFGCLCVIACIAAVSVVCYRPKAGPVVVVIDEQKPVYVVVEKENGKKELQKWEPPPDQSNLPSTPERPALSLVQQSPNSSRSKVAPAPMTQIVEVRPKAFPKVPCGRFNSNPELELEVVPATPWICEQPPALSCKEELAMNRRIFTIVPELGRIINDVSMKVFEMQYVALPTYINADSKFAIAAYTHDLGKDDPKGNLYFELNRQLQQRSFMAQNETRETWGVFMHYLMSGLSQLSDWHGDCFRGCSNRYVIEQQYELGSEVQWGNFVSASSTIESAKAAIDHLPRNDTVIFRISVTSGRDVEAYSFLPSDGEILLTPNHRFTVRSKPYELEDFLFIDLEEVEGDVFNVR